MNETLLDILFHEIRVERLRQIAKWGEQHHSHEKWLAILVEEVGEVAKAILEDNKVELQKELIQVLAVVVAWMEDKIGE